MSKPRGISRQIEYFYNWLLIVEPRPFLAIFGAFTATWGAWLLLPWVNTFESSGLYETLFMVAPENGWGALLVVVGVGQMYHAFRPVRRGAVVVSFAAVAVWAFIVAAFFVSARLTTAIPVYGWVLAWNCWLAYRVRGERVNGWH